MKRGAPCLSVGHLQQGIALFVALIAMVLLGLGGMAVMRAVDTTASVAANIAFRQASIGPVNQAVEAAIDALFTSKTILRQDVNDTAHGYYALLQAAELANGVPDVLAGNYMTMQTKYASAGLPAASVDPVTQTEVRSVIERICSSASLPPWPVTAESCDTLPPKVTPAYTSINAGPIPMPPLPVFRVTVRVDIPNSNTVSHAQAFVHAGTPAKPGAGIRRSWRLLHGD
jgi:Tfp pilus assembly protein PilX